MRRLLSWQLQTKLHIFLDKILHKHLRISDSKLNRTGIQYIFTIGKQVAAVKSMLAYYRKYIEEGGAIDGCNLPGTVENAVLQYANRMSFLAETGPRLRQLAKRALLVRAEDLIGKPRSVLSQLQRFLHLRSP